MINAAFNDQATAEKLIQPIDVSKIPNGADLSPDKSGSPLLNHDGKVFGVPWVWGLTALAINEKSFPTPPTSISVMWDEAHKGRVVLRDDALEAVQFGAIATGQNINDIKDLDAVKARLTSLMPQIRTFWSSENDWNQMVASNQIDIGTYWSGSADRAKTTSSCRFAGHLRRKAPSPGSMPSQFPLAPRMSPARKPSSTMIDPKFYVEWVTRSALRCRPTPRRSKRCRDAFNRKVMGDPAVAKRISSRAPITTPSARHIWRCGSNQVDVVTSRGPGSADDPCRLILPILGRGLLWQRRVRRAVG
jgi:spermidine/putrescine transport system substrate-binding protein